MLGVCLGGGGTKGSYQLGAWRALKELNIDFDIITGVSIGSLNAAMMIEDNIEKCSKLWSSVQSTNIIKDGFDIEEVNLIKIIQQPSFKPFIKNYIKDKDSTILPFKEMVNTYVDYNKIRNSKKKFGVILSSFPLRKIEEVYMNNLNDIDMFNAFISSCSVFPVFPVASFQNKQYIDGGYSDNLPIDFTFKLGASKVIAIDLDDKVTHNNYLKNPYVSYIYPKWELGSFLHFNQSIIQKNMILGYYDTMKIFNKYNGFKYTFIIDDKFINIAKSLTLNILNDNIYINNNNLKKPLNKSIISYLNEHINRRINDYDYFIKTIEELGVIYNINPCCVYSTTDFINLILNEIKKNNYVNQTPPKILSNNKKEVINYLFKNDFDYNFKIDLLQSSYSLYLALMFIESVGDINEI